MYFPRGSIDNRIGSDNGLVLNRRQAVVNLNQRWSSLRTYMRYLASISSTGVRGARLSWPRKHAVAYQKRANIGPILVAFRPSSGTQWLDYKGFMQSYDHTKSRLFKNITFGWKYQSSCIFSEIVAGVTQSLVSALRHRGKLINVNQIHVKEKNTCSENGNRNKGNDPLVAHIYPASYHV